MARKKKIVGEIKEEVKEIVKNAEETAAEEVDGLTGKGEKKKKKAGKQGEENKEGFADTDFGIDVFSQQ